MGSRVQSGSSTRQNWFTQSAQGLTPSNLPPVRFREIVASTRSSFRAKIGYRLLRSPATTTVKISFPSSRASRLTWARSLMYASQASEWWCAISRSKRVATSWCTTCSLATSSSRHYTQTATKSKTCSTSLTPPSKHS